MSAPLPGRIGINAVFLEPRMGGLDTYVRALLPELMRLAPQVRFSVFCSPGGREYLKSEPWAAEAELITHPLLGRRGLKAVGELTVLGAIAGRQVDLLHSAAMTAPLRTRAVNVVTLADVTWLVAPDPGEMGTVRVWRALVPAVARRADRVIALSQAGADHVVEHLRVPAERIDVVPLAAGSDGSSAPTPERELRSRLELGEGPVILSVSAKKVHKNLERLVEAMAKVAQDHPEAKLVLPGNHTAHEDELRELAAQLGIAANVAFPPYVDAADLEGLYALARCFVFASINEGFGIPILEAMRRGVPVACSRASALPEVAGEAARYFDPYSIPDIAQALDDLLEDRSLAERLAAQGRAREARFTWQATAEGTLESYERAWSQSRRPDARAGAHAGAPDRAVGMLRKVSAHPRVLPLTALALRARTVRPAPAFFAREGLGSSALRLYRLRESDLRVAIRHGSGDAVTLGEVFHERDYRPPAELERTLGQARQVLDLGANVGLFGAYAAARWSAAEIVAFEPDPANAAVHRMAIAANGLQRRWRLVQAAAGARDGSAAFAAGNVALSHLLDSGTAGAIAQPGRKPGSVSTIEVPVRDVLPLLARTDLLKMDIEGGEWAILGDPRFRTGPPLALVLEYHPHLCPERDPRATVEALLGGAGMRVRAIWHREDGHGMLWAWRE